MGSSAFGRRPLAVILLAVLAVTAPAAANHYDDDAATGSFAMDFGATTDTTLADSATSLSIRASQPDHGAVVKSYAYTIPAGWRFAFGSIDPSTLATCRDADAFAAIATKAEKIGTARVMLNTDTTRDPTPSPPGLPGPGSAWYTGGLWFLRWEQPTNTATVCAVLTRTRGRETVGTPVQVVSEITLRLLGDKSGELSFDLDAVPGAPAGERSITDNAAFQQHDTSVVEALIAFGSLTDANYNTNPSGVKQGVVLSRTPALPGVYAFTGTFTPCASNDATTCKSPFGPITRTDSVSITAFPVGYHPAPTITAPGQWAVLRGNSSVTVRWTQPAASSRDPIKGYVLTVSQPAVPGATYHERRITDVTDPAYAAANDPCGASPSCAVTLSLPLTASNGAILPANAVHTAELVTLFRDGHRSDGRCDDESRLGTSPPCADGSSPAVAPPGVASVQFLNRTRAWPLAYRQDVPRTDGKGIFQIYVLLADMEQQSFEFVLWKAVGQSYPGGGAGVIGASAAGGVILGFNFSHGAKFALQAILTPAIAEGLFETFNAQNVPTSQVIFEGRPA